MANPTTYFGWVMPNSADLVTDLPADFNVFGQGVDTSMQYLLGGTTGQILSKTSGTNMAFTWINNDQGDITGVTAGTGITGGGTSGTVTITNDMATTITAAGDIVVGTGSGTYDNLPIGTTAQVLTADTTVSPYKVKWATPGGGSPFAADISVNGLTVGKGTASGASNTTLGVSGLLAVTTGLNDTAIGNNAGKAITTGSGNTAVGSGAATALTTTTNLVAIGKDAAKAMTTGNTGSVVIGANLMPVAVTGNDNNVVIGQGCFDALTAGYQNVVIGQTCLESQTAANYNIAIGVNAGTGTGGGDDNIYIGRTIRSSSGAQNTIVGAATGNVSATYSNVSLLGNGAVASSTSASNTITLGNASVTALRCQVTSITSLSDERDKKNIEPLEIGLDFINTLKPVSFDWNMRPKLDDDGNVISTGKIDMPDVGFIAQDLIKAEDDSNFAEYLQLSYRDNPDALEASQGRLIPILVKAIQDLSAKIATLEANA